MKVLKDGEETLVLRQDPKRATHSKIDIKKLRREREICNSKIRYERIFNPVEESDKAEI